MSSYPRLSTRIHQALEQEFESSSYTNHTNILADISSQSYTLDYLSKLIEQKWPQESDKGRISFKRSDFGSGEQVSEAYKAFLEDSNEFSDAGEQDTCKVLYNLLTSKKPYRDQHQAVLSHFGSYASTPTSGHSKGTRKEIDVAAASKTRRDAIERLHAAAEVLSASVAGNAAGARGGKGTAGGAVTVSCSKDEDPPTSHHRLFAQALRIPFHSVSSSHLHALRHSTAYFEGDSDDSWTSEEAPAPPVHEHVHDRAPAPAPALSGTGAPGRHSVEKISAVVSSAPAPVLQSNADANWLLSMCADHLHTDRYAYTTRVYELAQQIHALCCTEHAAAAAARPAAMHARAPDELPGMQDALFNLLGEEGFELMIQVWICLYVCV